MRKVLVGAVGLLFFAIPTLVRAGPLAFFTATPNPASPGQSIFFDGTGSFGAIGFDWNFGDATGVSGPATTSHTYAAFGSYTATLFVNDGRERVSTSRTIIVDTPPIADAGGPYAWNPGFDLTLDASRSRDPDRDDHIVTYKWDLNNDSVYDIISPAG